MAYQTTDAGWSWCVCLSGCIIRILLNGFLTSIGLFFIHWEREFDSDASSVAVIGSIIMCSWLMGPIVSSLGHRFTNRTVAVLSGLTIMLSFVTGSQLAHKLWHLYIMAIFAALGIGFAWYISVAHVTFYFVKKLGFALSLVTGFAASGTLILPFFFQMCLEEYGWRGTLLLTAGIMGNITAFAMLLRPVQNSANIQFVKALLHVENKPQIQNRKMSAKFKQHIYTRASRFNLNILCRSLPFWMSCLLSLANGFGFTPVFVYIAPHAVKLQIEEFKGALLLMIMGVCSMLARFSAGIFVDKNIITAWKFSAICLVLNGICCLILPANNSFMFLATVSSFYGFTNGGAEVLYFLVIVELVGQKDSYAGIAWGSTLWAIGSVCSIYLAGYLYDNTGSYNAMFTVTGCILFCSAAVSLCTNQIHKLQTKIESKRGSQYCAPAI